ncbi:CvpA family protein [Nitrospinae bacterium]|nr:CvpA family protein [Nitrospinota bacterium]
MTTFDIIVFSILGLSVVLSLFKGLVKEIFSLLSYLGGYLMAAHYQQSFAQVFIEIIPSKAIAKLIAFIAIYIFTAIIISLIGRVFRSMIISATKLSIFDRLIGGVVGFGKGLIIIVAIIYPIQFFPNISQKLTQDSQTAPYLAKVLQLINQKSASFDIRGKLDNLNIDEAKEKVDELINLDNMADKLQDLKEKLPSMEKQFNSEDKPLDEYSTEDLQKLNDIIKSVEKK